MKRKIIGLTALAALLMAVVTLSSSSSGRRIEVKDATFLRQIQARDSILIADQLRYGFSLKAVPEGTFFALPDYSQGFMDSVEVVGQWSQDTVGVKTSNGKTLYDLENSLVITSFDEGEYELRPLSAVRYNNDGSADTLVFGGQNLKVCTMPVDTATFQIYDIKDVLDYPPLPLTWGDIWPWLLAALGVILLGVLVWYLLKVRRKREAARQLDPPYIVALRKLDKFRGNAFWAPEKQKAYYSGITDSLREYMTSVMEFDATKMTTPEVLKMLKTRKVDQTLQSDMKTLFEGADFVKFAKHVASDEENAWALPAAVHFVNETWQEKIQAEAAEAAAAAASDKKKEESGR